MKRFTINIPEELDEKLKKKSEDLGMNKSTLIRVILMRHLEKFNLKTEINMK